MNFMGDVNLHCKQYNTLKNQTSQQTKGTALVSNIFHGLVHAEGKG
jgi:hypothetical protein